jgi:HEAT repeat protein
MNNIVRAVLGLLALAPLASIATASDVTALAQKLKSASAIDRRQAVLDLSADGSPAAWPFVIEALHDADAMVADEAELVLGNVKDASIAKGLLAKDGISANDPWVRIRAAEALGRMKVEIDAAPLCRHMSDKDPELRRIVAWTIERLARGDHIEAKSKRFAKQELEDVVKKDADPNVRAAALSARHALEPLTISYLFEVISSAKQPGIVHAATTHLIGAVDSEQLSIVASSVAGEDLCVRQAYVRELGRAATRTSLHSLVLRLSADKNLRLTWTIVELLQNLSGEMIKSDPVKWLEWELKQPADWKAKSPAFAKDAKHEYDTSSAFMDMPSLSNHIVVLFDFSESMSTKLASGKTRKDTIELELRQWLEHLPNSSEFNLIPYAETPQPCEKALVAANAASVKRALACFKDCKLAGKSNFWDAFLVALSDPKADTILVVSNGEPACGRHENLELIGALAAERNRFRHVALDALILNSKPEVQDLWREIASRNGGRMSAIDMK